MLRVQVKNKRHPLRSKSEFWLRNIVVLAVLIFFVVFFIIPIFVVLIGSFYQWNPLKEDFRFLGIENWINIMKSSLFWSSMINTILFAGIATICRLVLGFLLSCALYSKLVRYKSFFRLLYYLPTITPLVAISFVWKFIFDPQFGLMDRILHTNINWLFDSRFAMAAILMLTIWKDFGFAVVILLGGQYGLPRDYYEAAEVDGAGGWKQFWYITLPLLKPTVLFVVITSLISYFQTYIPVMVLTQGGPGTRTYLAPYLIYDQAFVKYNFGYASALSFVLFIFIAILTRLSFFLSGDSVTEN